MPTGQSAEKLFNLGGITPEPPRYLWEEYLRRGTINAVIGDGGSGKTMLTCALAAAIANGRQPEDMPGTLLIDGPGNVLLFGVEDDAPEYRHRLDLCGCDAPENIYTAPALEMPVLCDRLKLLEMIQQTNARLVVFDPLQAFLPRGTDLNKAADVRPILEALRSVCKETDCTAVLVGHLNKAEKASAVQRGMGSMDITNAARSVLFVANHPREPGMHVALHVKANARRGLPIQFAIDSAGSFSFQGTCEITEGELLEGKAARGTLQSPVERLFTEVALANPDGWVGTAKALSELPQNRAGLSCKSIGKTLPGLLSGLKARGITVSKRNTSNGIVYAIYRGGDAL